MTNTYEWTTSRDHVRSDTATVKTDTHFLELKAFTVLTGEGEAECRFVVFQYVPVDSDHPQGFTYIRTETKVCSNLAEGKKWLRGKARQFVKNPK